MSSYKPTGYRPGRPRKGEIRPVSPGAVVQHEYRAQRILNDPDYLALCAVKAAIWRENNLDRAKEINRGTHHRAKSWKLQQGLSLAR